VDFVEFQKNSKRWCTIFYNGRWCLSTFAMTNESIWKYPVNATRRII